MALTGSQALSAPNGEWSDNGNGVFLVRLLLAS
jgi:hypothetical protein